MMQEFDYELVYKPGTTNRIADPLLRLNVTMVFDMDPKLKDKFIKGYKEDGQFKELYAHMRRAGKEVDREGNGNEQNENERNEEERNEGEQEGHAGTGGHEHEQVMRLNKSKHKFPMQKLKHYQLRNGLLYFSPHKLDFTRLVVPRYDSLQVDILHDYHDSVVAGHMGMDKTYEGIQRIITGPIWPMIYGNMWRLATNVKGARHRHMHLTAS